MSCRVTSSCHVMLCYVASCHIMLCRAALHCAVLCHVISYHVMSCHVMSCHIMPCHIMLHHIVSCHIISCRIMSCNVKPLKNTHTPSWALFGVGGHGTTITFFDARRQFMLIMFFKNSQLMYCGIWNMEYGYANIQKP